MIALTCKLNQEEECRASVREGVVCAIVTVAPDQEGNMEVSLELTGQKGKETSLRWLSRRLNPGDEIRIRVLEGGGEMEASPASIVARDRVGDEHREREYYEFLRQKFENQG